MTLPIVMSSEEQASVLKDCDNKLEEFRLVKEEMIDNIMLWPKVNLGNIFQYILSTRDFDSDYIGKY